MTSKPPCEPCGKKRKKGPAGVTRVYANKANLRWCKEKGLDLPCIVVEKDGQQKFVRGYDLPGGVSVIQDLSKSPSVWVQFSEEIAEHQSKELEPKEEANKTNSGLSARARAKGKQTNGT